MYTGANIYIDFIHTHVYIHIYFVSKDKYYNVSETIILVVHKNKNQTELTLWKIICKYKFVIQHIINYRSSIV